METTLELRPVSRKCWLELNAGELFVFESEIDHPRVCVRTGGGWMLLDRDGRIHTDSTDFDVIPVKITHLVVKELH